MEALSNRGLDIVEEASNGNEGVEKALAVNPDVVLSDLNMPEADGIVLTRILQEKAPKIRVLLFTVSENDENLALALNSGARGYLLKNENVDIVAEAVNYVAHGGVVISPSMANKVHVDIVGPTPEVDDSTSEDAPEAVIGEAETVPRVETSMAAEEDAPSEEETVDSEEPAEAAVGSEEYEPTKEHELVFTSPAEPNLILRVLNVLSKETGCDVVKVEASFSQDTVVYVKSGLPVQLRDALAGIPQVANVTEEPSPSNGNEPKRLRLALKNA